MKYLILLLFIVLCGCSLISKNGYLIKESSNQNWRFKGGEFLLKGDEEEIKYSIEYIGNKDINPLNLTFEFLICPINSQNEDNINSAVHLHSNINGYLNKKIDSNFSLNNSFKGDLIESDKDYTFEKLYLKISYTIDGMEYEEVLILPMEKM